MAKFIQIISGLFCPKCNSGSLKLDERDLTLEYRHENE